MKIKKLLVTILLILSASTVINGQKATCTPPPKDRATIYLRECVTSVSVFLQTNKDKAGAITACDNPLLGMALRPKRSSSKVVIENGELKSVEVKIGPRTRSYDASYSLRMRMTRCGCKPNVACCCDSWFFPDMCCLNDFCCTFSKYGPPVCH
jgi:hypothetical protein